MESLFKSFLTYMVARNFPCCNSLYWHVSIYLFGIAQELYCHPQGWPKREVNWSGCRLSTHLFSLLLLSFFLSWKWKSGLEQNKKCGRDENGGVQHHCSPFSFPPHFFCFVLFHFQLREQVVQSMPHHLTWWHVCSGSRKSWVDPSNAW